MKKIENKDQEVKKITIVEVPYKIMKEYFAAQNKNIKIRGDKK